MILDKIIMVLTFAVSAIAIFLAIKKQPHDEKNTDADTIGKMLENFDQQEERYQALKSEFHEYKKLQGAKYKEMEDRFAVLAAENVKLRAWARKLVAQLEAANIVPVKYEE